ncbi:sugar ABC transporter ATP-binding protein [uncultured Arthrobacter sp.]|uniref:sugar ABC transporter ATP-binding protein n=1 Tax=uncultured Arthrobacter sp. TaxID=114050 RepID=UPI0025D14D86|nr:sugar ABC transporter ATP-binding protein [uncultured Arthrobacter sp.]
MEDPVLEIRGLGKHFGGHTALADVDFTLRRGEIHALLGENGAGKSTLIKILAGAIQRDTGDILVAGEEVARRASPADVARLGLAFVHQDLGLVDQLSVAENLALEVGYERHHGLISFRETERRAARLLADVGTAVSTQALVGDLSQDEKVMVAVTRAVSRGARIIVLDEVSASLPAPEFDRLADSLRVAQERGVGYVYVTHRLEEVFELADRVTVLRDGRRVATAPVAETSHDEVVEWILGGALAPPGAVDKTSAHGQRPVRLQVRDLLSAGLAGPISFEVAAGEILGICGLIGSGTREVARLLGGAAKPDRGTARLDGKPLPLGEPHRLVGMGVSYVPGSRLEGAVPEMAIRENFFLSRRQGPDTDDPFVRVPWRERVSATRLAEKYDVRPRGAVERPLAALSGGNQQKVIFGRALRAKPRLLVLDDPTAGVDVGSRLELHGFLRETLDSGTSIVLASTDFAEVASQADRVLVMRHGRVEAELPRDQLTPDGLARASYGTPDQNASKEDQT